jgi:hypothetical protein
MAATNFDRYNLGWDSADLGATRVGDNVREDLSNMIYNIAPYMTPFMTMSGTGRARNTYTEWQTDDLGSVLPSNALVDGAIAGDDTASASKRVGNQCQISDKVLKISGRAEAVDKAGRRSEMGYQLAKAGKKLKRDMESIMTSSQGSVGGDSTTASTTAGVGAWISTNNVSPSGAGDVPGWAAGFIVAPTPGTPRTLTEALIRAGMLAAYLEGGEPGTLMCSPQKKQEISEYLFTSSARVATLYRDTQGESSQSTAMGAVDVFVTDFGALKLVPNRFWGHNGTIPDDTYIAGLQENMWATMYLRSFRTNRLAKTGDAENRQLIVDYGVRANNEAANFQIRDLDNTAMTP